MDFKKAYKEALERAKAGKPLDEVFPELNESEDERIRKEIIEFINWAESCGAVRIDWHQKKCPGNWIAYLERQKEQKPAEWSEEDENWSKYLLDELYAGLEDYCGAAKKDMKEAIKWFKTRLKSLRPKPHWKPSEEQIEALKDVIDRALLTCRQQVPLESLYNDLQKLL